MLLKYVGQIFIHTSIDTSTIPIIYHYIYALSLFLFVHMYTLIFVLYIYMYIYKFFLKKIYTIISSVISGALQVFQLSGSSPSAPRKKQLSQLQRQPPPRGFEEFFAKLARDPLVQAGPGRTLDGLISEKNMIKLENKRVQGDRSKTKLFVFSAPSTAMKIQAAFVFSPTNMRSSPT